MSFILLTGARGTPSHGPRTRCMSAVSPPAVPQESNSFIDPSGLPFVVLNRGIVVPWDAFTFSDGLVIPVHFVVRRHLSDVIFEGRVDAEAAEPFSGAGEYRPVFLVHGRVGARGATSTFGPRCRDGSLASADDVWLEAVRAMAPSCELLVTATGGLAMFGLTCALLQRQLALGAPLPRCTWCFPPSKLLLPRGG